MTERSPVSPVRDRGAALIHALYARTADRYDAIEPGGDRADVAFYRHLGLAAGGPVLELGSGTGRVLLALAAAGLTVTGVELVEAMQERCRLALSAQPPEVQARVELVTGDLREIDLGRRFALVVCPFRTFQHLLTPLDQAACLAVARRHLLPGGLLALDVARPWPAAALAASLDCEITHDAPVTLADGRSVQRRHRLREHAAARQCVVCELIDDVTWPDGRVEREITPYEMRYTHQAELAERLLAAGFVVEACYADFAGTPAHDDTDDDDDVGGDLVVLARCSAFADDSACAAL